MTVSVVRESRADLDRLRLTLRAPDGSIAARWADDEPDVENVPLDLAFGSSLPGGDADLSCALLRDMRQAWSDLKRYADVTASGPGGEDAWRGYLVRYPDSPTRVSPAAVGDAGRLKDDPSLRLLCVDRDPSRWTTPPAARRLLLNSLGAKVGDMSIADDPAGAAALHLRLVAPWTFIVIAEAFYDSRGVGVKRLDWDRISDSDQAAQPVAGFAFYAFGTDSPLNSPDITADQHVATEDSEVGSFTFAQARRFAAFSWQYPGGAVAGSAEYSSYVRKPVVFGEDVATSTDASGIRGVLGPDVLRAALDLTETGIGYSSDSIAADPFVIPQLAWLDPVTPEQAILDVNRFYRNLWAVYDRTLIWRPPETFGSLWRVYRSDGISPESNGPDADQDFNGVIVRYSDPLTGSEEIVGPPETGLLGPTSLSTATLRNLDPDLELNQYGRRRFAVLQAGLTSEAGAIRLGELFQAGAAARQLSGAVSVGAFQLVDETGARYPAWAARAGDRLLVADDRDATERLIVEARYSHADRRSSLTLDSAENALEALLERLQVVLVGVEE